MQKNSNKRDWFSFVVEIIKLTIAFIAGNQINL